MMLCQSSDTASPWQAICNSSAVLSEKVPLFNATVSSSVPTMPIRAEYPHLQKASEYLQSGYLVACDCLCAQPNLVKRAFETSQWAAPACGA